MTRGRFALRVPLSAPGHDAASGNRHDPRVRPARPGLWRRGASPRAALSGRAGFACIAWDKPGVGKSTGDYNNQTLRDRADEALAAVRFLRSRKDIRPDRIGLWGHSQGGMVAPLAASLSQDVAFLIEVSGWQGPAWKQDAVRVEAELREAGFRESDIERAVTFARMRMDMIRGTCPYKDLEAAQNAVKTLPWFLRSVHFRDLVRFESARRNVGEDTSPWWSRVRCPVLVLYGDRDTSGGPPEPLVAIIRRGLEAVGNEDVTVRIFRDADHSLCRADRPVAARAAHRRKNSRTSPGRISRPATSRP